MYGRYGNDALTKFLLILALILMIVSLIPRLWWMYFLAAAVLIWSLTRSFSRRFDKRRRELDRYLKIKTPIVNFFKLSRNKWRDRHYEHWRIARHRNRRRFYSADQQYG